MFVPLSEPALKCENNAICKQNYTLKLFIAFKMAYSCSFGLRRNLDFRDFVLFKHNFLQKICRRQRDSNSDRRSKR